MLYELVLLPIRFDDTYELSTQVPLFSSIQSNSPDDCVILGNVIHGDEFKLFKYKAIEQYGQFVIERLILSIDEIDIACVGWWKTDTSVTVLQTKCFMKDCAYVVRNVKSARGILCSSDSYMYDAGAFSNSPYYDVLTPMLQNTNNNRLTDALTTFAPNSDIDLVTLIHARNSNTTHFEELRSQIDIGNMCKDVIKVPYQTFAYTADSEIELSSLTRFINRSTVAARSMQELTDCIRPKFHLDESAVSGVINHSWTLLELLYRLNSSAYTNIKIEYNTSNPMANMKGSTYTGIKCNPEPVLCRLFEIWVKDQIRSMCLDITHASLEKTYSEEVFIELRCQDRKVVRYYFDLVLFVIGSIVV